MTPISDHDPKATNAFVFQKLATVENFKILWIDLQEGTRSVLAQAWEFALLHLQLARLRQRERKAALSHLQISRPVWLQRSFEALSTKAMLSSKNSNRVTRHSVDRQA